MKKTASVFLILYALAMTPSSASVNTNEALESYVFRFKPFQGEIFAYEIKSPSSIEAFEKAAQACFDHFKAGRHIKMEYAQDIIDVCVNPHSNI